MHVNRNFYLWLLLFIASIVGISFYGGSISFGFFHLCTLIPVISMLYLLRIYFKFKIYQRTEGRNLTAGKPSPFYFKLQNEDIFSYSGIQVLYYSSLSQIVDLEDGVEYELLPKSTIEKTTTIMCKYRGDYAIGIKQVVLQDYLKMFKLTYKNPSQLTVIVYPNIIMLDELRSVDIPLITAKESILNETEPDVIVRKYNNDEMRRINWKVSAKCGELMVRKTIGEEKCGIGLVMSGKRYSSNREDYLPLENKMIETNLAVCMYFAMKNTPVETFFFDGELVEGYTKNLEEFEKFYEQMSIYGFNNEYEDESLFNKLVQNGSIFRNKIVFLILHKWSEKAENFARILNENNISVVVYIVTDDEKISDAELIKTTIKKIGIEDDLKSVM